MPRRFCAPRTSAAMIPSSLKTNLWSWLTITITTIIITIIITIITTTIIITIIIITTTITIITTTTSETLAEADLYLNEEDLLPSRQRTGPTSLGFLGA